MRSTTKTTSKVLLSVLCRSFCILSLVHLGIQATQHRPQQGQFKRRIMVPFMNEDFARSEEILNADPFAKKHIHRPFSVSGLAFPGRPSAGLNYEIITQSTIEVSSTLLVRPRARPKWRRVHQWCVHRQPSRVAPRVAMHPGRTVFLYNVGQGLESGENPNKNKRRATGLWPPITLLRAARASCSTLVGQREYLTERWILELGSPLKKRGLPGYGLW